MPPQSMMANMMAGGLIATINITVAISVAALMFTGTNPTYFATGVSILLVGTLILGLGGTLGSGLPGIIVAPRSGLAPVFLSIVTAVIAAMSGDGDGSGVMPTIVMTFMVTTACAGLVLVFLGLLKLGRLVRYIPYPVMGGFFAGIGLLFVKGGIAVASGVTPESGNLAILISPPHLFLILPAVAFAIILYQAQRRLNHWAIFPVLLLASFAIFYTVFTLTDQSFETAVESGWLPEVAATTTHFPIFDFTTLGYVDWTVVSGQAGSIAVVAILCAIILLIDISGVEIITQRDLNPDHELKVAGMTNLVNGIMGGFPGVHVASDTAFTYKLGGKGRLMGFVYSAAVATAIIAGTRFIGTIPNFILGGLLVYVGIDFLVDWAWQTRRDLPLVDYAVILAILSVIGAIGILEGVAFGFAVAIIIFVISYSRVSIIRSVVSGNNHASYVDRDLNTRALLDRESYRILIIKLQGFIFFGTADSLIAAVKNEISRRREKQSLRYLILDFQHVSQLDTSAVRAFAKLAQLADSELIHITVTSIDGHIRARLESIAFFSPSTALVQRLEAQHLDDGVAWCEEHILVVNDIGHSDSRVEIQNHLAEVLGDTAAAETITAYFEPVKVKKGTYLFRQGEPGDCLYLVHSGAAVVVLPLADGQERIIRVYRAGAVLGEMAIYTGAPRSANVRIEENSLLFRLNVSAMKKMQQRHPAAAGQFHSFVVRLLAERLNRANKEWQHNT